MEEKNEEETTDEIIQEMRRIKKNLAKSKDFDINRIIEDAKRKQAKSNRRVLSPPVQQAP